MKKDREENQANLKKVFSVSHVWKNGRTKMQQPYLVREQQMLAMGHAFLCQRQNSLLLDEPSMGLAQSLSKRSLISSKISKNKGQRFLLIEQNANKALLAIADRGYAFGKQGKLVLTEQERTLSPLRRESAKAYLGG